MEPTDPGPDPATTDATTDATLQLDPRVIGYWRLSAFVRSALFSLPLAVALAVAAGRFVHPVAGLCVATGWGFLFALQVLLWPRLSWAWYRYGVREGDLWIGSGVLWRQETVIPLSRIQFVDSRQGPLERLFDLSRVYVYTASGPAPDGGVPGLKSEDAARLRDLLAHARTGTPDGT
jgi:uncharacterized protein